MTDLENIKILIQRLNEWTKAYDEGHPVVPDREWDNAYFRLVLLEKETGIYLPDSPTQQINYEVVTKLNKVKHNHPMLSLDKTKDWNEFLNYFYDIDTSKDVVGMIKLDGLTCSLHYSDGKLISAETRGNGEIGEDILHNAKVIKSIPNYIDYKEDLIIDGEVICTYEDFKPFSAEYKNPRNFASGSIRLLDSAECAKRNLTFVVWNVINGFNESNSFMYKLNQLEDLGFNIVPFTSSFDLDTSDFLKNQAKKYGYPIDGLVGRFDDLDFGAKLGSTEHHAKSAYAFKFYDETYPTILHDVEWSMGRTGVLTPIAVFEPIDIDGTIVERASLHNLSIMKDLFPDNNWRSGLTAYVYKANAIIPQIAELRHEISTCAKRILIPKKCPICGEDTQIIVSDTGTKNLVCTNPKCEGKLINKIDHYCGKKGLDIKGLSEATIEKLIEWGWLGNITDLYVLKYYKKDWIDKDGFGYKSVDNILKAIENSLNCNLNQFISAIGIPLIGTTASKDLANRYKTWNNFKDTIINNPKDILNIEGFGYEMYKAITTFNYKEADIIAEMLTFKTIEEKEKDNNLDGLSIVITGKLTHFKNRDELKAEIENHGGKVAGSISSKTAYLINNDIDSTTGKNKKAKELGIPIISEQDFLEKFLT